MGRYICTRDLDFFSLFFFEVMIISIETPAGILTRSLISDYLPSDLWFSSIAGDRVRKGVEAALPQITKRRMALGIDT